jgi:RND family efflux transporter MFP subunit
MRTASCALLLAAVAFTACGKGKDAEGADSTRVVTGAKTIVVAEQPFSETIDATAVVSGRPGHVAILSAPSAARVAAVHVVVGQHVAVGDALVELDQVAFRAAVNTTDAALAAAEKQFARQQRLADAGIAPRRDVDLAAAELAAARGAAETAHRQADLSVVHSPIAGVVTQVSAVLGATADPAQALVQVADGSVLDLVLTLPPAQAATLHTGVRVDILGEGKGATALGEGTLTAIGGAVDSATRAVIVRVGVQRSSRLLKIGETVAVRITAASRPRALVVPIEALVPDGEGFKVFVVDAGAVAHARPVEVGGRSDAVAEITKGLAAGERVVTYGAYGMDDSVKVAPAAKKEGEPTSKAAAKPAPDSK